MHELMRHKNGILTDNRIENLEIMGWSAHTNHHATGRRRTAWQTRRTIEIMANYREEFNRQREINTALYEALKHCAPEFWGDKLEWLCAGCTPESGHEPACHWLQAREALALVEETK